MSDLFLFHEGISSDYNRAPCTRLRSNLVNWRQVAKWMLIAGMMIVILLIAATWLRALERQWTYGFARLSAGHVFVYEHGYATWRHGWHLVRPWQNAHRVDAMHDVLLWDGVGAWQIANMSWRWTVVPLWPLMVVLASCGARLFVPRRGGYAARRAVIVGTLTRALAIVAVLALAYGPVDRWLSGRGVLGQRAWPLYVATHILSVAVVACWAACRLRRQLALLQGGCWVCGYNLTGNVSGICPECGTPIRVTPVQQIPG